MRSSRVYKRALVTSLFTLSIGLAVVPTASAEPNDVTDPAPPAPGPVADAPAIAAPAAAGANPAIDACRQFSGALAYAANNYEDFAYATAGNGDYVNYADPQVSESNIVGRTALREAAGVALDASGTPGLAPEIADPMRKWSLNAARLVLTMGLRGGGNALNGAADDLNNNARDVQMACAAAGTAA
jgi:hypothetical protein